MPITTIIVSSNPARGEVYSILHYVMGRLFSLGTLVSFTSIKTDRHDIAEILLKVTRSPSIIYENNKEMMEGMGEQDQRLLNAT